MAKSVQHAPITKTDSVYDTSNDPVIESGIMEEIVVEPGHITQSLVVNY